MGGGTTDVAIVEVTENGAEVLGTASDTHFGEENLMIS
jgi:molecular chaperone DnaK (HSP70)